MEEEKTRKKGEPLLYIAQPEFADPDLTMQNIYHSTSSQDEDITKEIKENQIVNEEQQEQEEQPELVENKEDIPKEKEPGQVVTEEVQSKWRGGLRKVKSFREMSLEEKLEYLSGFSITQPPYYCEFITPEHRHRGSVLKYEKELVRIKTLTGEEVVVPVIEIKMIRIIR